MSGAISDKWINYADLWTPDKDTFQGVIKAIIKSVSTQKKQQQKNKDKTVKTN